jgi:hypothetical protein
MLLRLKAFPPQTRKVSGPVDNVAKLEDTRTVNVSKSGVQDRRAPARCAIGEYYFYYHYIGDLRLIVEIVVAKK